MNETSNRRGRKTLGGLQFWTDWRWNHGWRLQRHWQNDRARVLDPDNRAVAYGSFDHCVSQFELETTSVTEDDSKPLVVLLHGMNRTRNTFRKMEQAIWEAGFLTARLSYASTRQRIAESARGLQSVIEHLPVQNVNFVAHSMGNLVVRRCLYEIQLNPDFQIHLEKLQRMVMIAPPNQGSKMARWLRFSLLFNLLSGVGGREFSWNWKKVEPDLAIPEFPFGVIAGAQKQLLFLSNPFLSGPDDWTVSLEETRLANEADRYDNFFLHGTIMKNRKVIDATIRFLKSGKFSENKN